MVAHDRYAIQILQHYVDDNKCINNNMIDWLMNREIGSLMVDNSYIEILPISTTRNIPIKKAYFIIVSQFVIRVHIKLYTLVFCGWNGYTHYGKFVWYLDQRVFLKRWDQSWSWYVISKSSLK